MGPVNKLAVYTTIYPGVEEYLPAWHASLAAQTDQNFDLWIGLDSLTSKTIEQVIGKLANAHWVPAESGSTPAQVRQQALSPIVSLYEGVILVDSDDLLHPSRVEAARHTLQDCGLCGCSLKLVNEVGVDLNLLLGVPPGYALGSVLPRHNVFGLSNSAFRAEVLQRCLPIPEEVDLVDWFLATRAWLVGARLDFDPCVRMSYRQHQANMARIRGPFTPTQVIQDTARVRKHFNLVRTNLPEGYLPDRLRELERTAEDVESFYERVTLDSSRLGGYVTAFNTLGLPPLWWSCVAHPALDYFWRPAHN
jgi:hypothetical protein